MNILFLCTGNISRSYLAEMLLKHEISRNRSDGIFVASAGILDNQGIPADPAMMDYLAKLNIPAGDHLSRTITKEDLEWADLIFVMEKRHREYLQNHWPEINDKVELLSKYISPDQFDDDIVDPYCKSPYHYRLAQSQITLAIKSLFKKLARK